jgi:hypothetical protein
MPGTAYEAASVDVECANTYDWPDIVVTKLVNGQKSVHVAPGSTVEYTVNIEYFSPEYAGYIALKDSKISDLSAILEVTSRDPRYVISSVDWSDDEEGTIIIDLDPPAVLTALSEDGDEPNPGEETNVITVKYSYTLKDSDISPVNNTAYVYVHYSEWEVDIHGYDSATVTFGTTPPPPPPPPPPPSTPTPTPTPTPPTDEPTPTPTPPVEEDDGEVLGEREDADIAGVVEKLPQTGGVSTTTLLGLAGILLVASGVITAVSAKVLRKRRRNNH